MLARAPSVALGGPFVFGTDPSAGRGQQMRTALGRYASALARRHRDDQEIR